MMRRSFLCENMEKITLCYQCKSIFKMQGYEIKRTERDIKEPCFICKRYGFEYEIKSGGERGTG